MFRNEIVCKIVDLFKKADIISQAEYDTQLKNLQENQHSIVVNYIFTQLNGIMNTRADVRAFWTSLVNDEFLLDTTSLTEIDNYLSVNVKDFLLEDIPTFVDYVFFVSYEYWIRNCPISERSKYKNIKEYIKKMKLLPVIKKNIKTSEILRPADDPTRWRIVVGKVIEVTEHPNSEKLWCEKIDIGEEKPRLIGSGLRKYIKKENFVGKYVFILANLKPKNLAGFISNGMVICVSNKVNDEVILLEPPESARIGDVVTFEGLSGVSDDILSQKKNNDSVSTLLNKFLVDNEGFVILKEHKLLLRDQPIKCETMKNCTVG